MKLALITPKGVYFSNDDKLSAFFKTFKNVYADNILMPRHEYWSGGSLGLLIVAALTPDGFEIEYIDENYEQVEFNEGYDLVAISAMTQQATRAYEIADEFRTRGCKVVIGGIHATVLPEEAKEHADSVVIGEAENTWPDLIHDFVSGNLKPFYKSPGLIDMTKSPLPRYELLKKYDYNMIWFQTTRGCPRDCDFCAASNIYGRAYRQKTIGQVLGEINYVRGLWDEPMINFADDNMFVNRQYSSELIRKLGQTGLRWTAQTDMSIADDELFLKLLKDTGCMLLFIGFETLSSANKFDEHDWKRNKIKKYPEIIRKIQGAGIFVFGAFIVGLDHDDASAFDALADFIIDNRLYAAQITVLTPLPGTRMRDRLMLENRITSHEWSKYTFRDVNIKPKNMTAEELQNGVMSIYERIYEKKARMDVVRHFKDIYVKLHSESA